MSKTPMILIHGASHGSWCWEPTLKVMKRDAVAVDLPGRAANPADHETITIDMFAACVTDAVEAGGWDKVTLVGHSHAGVTLAKLAWVAAPKIEHMVWVSCALPPHGQSVIDDLPTDIQEQAKAAAASSATSTLDPEFAKAMFCNDMTPKQTKFVLDNLEPEPWGPLNDQVSHSFLDNNISSTWVRLLQDAVISVEDQDARIKRLGGPKEVDVVDIDAGHDVMISDPKALAKVLDALP